MRLPLASLLTTLCGLVLLLSQPPGARADDGGGAPAAPGFPTGAAAPTPTSGSLIYSARVVHNDRQYLSYVHGQLDLGRNDFVEEISQSYKLDFKLLPGKLESAPQAMATIWQVGGVPAQRFGSLADPSGLPSFGSPLLRHFIIGEVVGRPETIRTGNSYLSAQLVIDSVQLDQRGFEFVGRYRGGPLVVVGSRQNIGGRLLPKDLAVLGPGGELYQYFFEDMQYAAQPLSPPLALPQFNPSDFVSFPAGDSQAVAIRPVKDWLVFQASLPSGRQLNLLLDSGSDTMIVDDLVLELDAKLTPAGETTMEGAVDSTPMKLYKGFSFNVGGVQFKNMPVVGGTITNIAMGAGMRIHGVVGSEILQLCQLDLDLEQGQMRLRPSEGSGAPAGQPLPITFINDFPHVEAEVAGKGKALMLLDTGQRSPVSVNIDALKDYQMDDSLVMDGFLGDVGGSLLPRYMLEKLDVTIGGQTFVEKTVDAAPEGTYEYNGLPVIGSIGFSLLARHFGGITFDYRNKYLYLRDPAPERVFKASAEAWSAWQPINHDEGRLGRKLAGVARGRGGELIAPDKPGKSMAQKAAENRAALMADLLGEDAPPAEAGAGAAPPDTGKLEGDKTAAGPQPPAEKEAPAKEAGDFRIHREPAHSGSESPPAEPGSESSEPASSAQTTPAGADAAGAEAAAALGSGASSDAERLPPMELKRGGRRLHPEDSTVKPEDDVLAPGDAAALQAPGEAAATTDTGWGPSDPSAKAGASLPPEDPGLLAALRSYGRALALALRAVYAFSAGSGG